MVLVRLDNNSVLWMGQHPMNQDFLTRTSPAFFPRGRLCSLVRILTSSFDTIGQKRLILLIEAINIVIFPVPQYYNNAEHGS
jgi:hypothetical protein